jgi:hypothetical protein
MFEKCVKLAGDPQCRSYLQEADRLTDGFMKCIESRSAEDCVQECLKECREQEWCGEACLGAMKAATGMLIARSIIEIAEAAVSLLNMDPVTAVAWAFYDEFEKVKGKDCPEKEVMAWFLAVAVIELYKYFKKAPDPRRRRAREVLLLTAPPLAEAYQCVGDEAFKYLDSIKPIVGERAVKRIVREMKEGGVFVGGVLITFKPVKAAL